MKELAMPSRRFLPGSLLRPGLFVALTAFIVASALVTAPELAAKAAGVQSSGGLGHFDVGTKHLYKPGAGVILAIAPLGRLLGAGMLLAGHRHAIRTLAMGIGI